MRKSGDCLEKIIQGNKVRTTHLVTEALLLPGHVFGTASQYTCVTKTSVITVLSVNSKRFWQCISIACYAERCLSHDRFCLSDRPTVWPSVTRWYHAKTIPATIMGSSLEDSPMTLVSWRLTSGRNSKGNIGSEGAEWVRGSKNVAKIGNF